ncbi:MAG TPA: winged helix DNA-binding domain-containing protein [Ktedonobacteraceae bacterium]|nr:winged helix DNA-binding domain-containing protein [Ktedonobacteraceae bacterium]
MTNLDIAHQRLHNQFLSQQTFEKPEDVVQWLGAVQSQDYGAAKWALGLRLQNAADDVIEQAFAGGAILRTHVMRPTWHFVTPADIRWMLALTAPRVLAAMAYYDRTLELDNAAIMKSNAVLAKALQGDKQLTRAELASELQQAGIACDNLQRLGHIIMHAELDGVVCSGARRGKQFTYALLDERAPQTRTVDHDEALAEFARRYFTSHGPATLQDFVWWSGLTMADAKAGLEMVSSQLAHDVVESQTYWFSPSTSPTYDLLQTIYLLPNFDEYTVGYSDRSAVIDESDLTKFDRWGNVLNNTVALDGRVIGTWKRVLKKNAVMITPKLFAPLSEAETCALAAAANRYGVFLGFPASVLE